MVVVLAGFYGDGHVEDVDDGRRGGRFVELGEVAAEGNTSQRPDHRSSKFLPDIMQHLTPPFKLKPLFYHLILTQFLEISSIPKASLLHFCHFLW